MSHFTKVKTKLTDKEILKKAMKRMGFKVQEGDFKITQYGTTEKAELKFDDAVGLARQEDGTFSMVGDFYHSKDKKMYGYYGRNSQFSQELSTAYAVEETTARLEEQNFFCTENTAGDVGEDGIITMTFESYS